MEEKALLSVVVENRSHLSVQQLEQGCIDDRTQLGFVNRVCKHRRHGICRCWFLGQGRAGNQAGQWL